MDLTISKVGKTYCDGGKNVEKMVKIHVERKMWAKKLLEKPWVSYEKQTNKFWKHIEFEINDLVWLNICAF